MTTTEFAALVRYKTRSNSVTFTDGDMLPLANTFKDEISSMIVERNNGMFLVPSTFDLVADQREYGFGDDLLNRIHKLEIKFASGDSRFPALYIKDYYGSETESEITKQFTNAEKSFAYTIRRRAVLLLSGTIVAVTDGGRLWSHIFPADLADLSGSTGIEVDPSTTTFGFPRQFHELLARRVGMERNNRNNKPLTALELRYDSDLKIQLDAIATIVNQGDIIGLFPPSEDLYNDGWDV